MGAGRCRNVVQPAKYINKIHVRKELNFNPLKA